MRKFQAKKVWVFRQINSISFCGMNQKLFDVEHGLVWMWVSIICDVTICDNTTPVHCGPGPDRTAAGCDQMGTLLLGWDTDSLMKYNICYFIKLIKLSNFLHVNFDFILFLSKMNSTLLRFLKLKVYISTWSYLLPLLFKFQWRIFWTQK